MYINRFTLSFPYQAVYINDEIKRFGSAAYFLEEILFSHLPNKVNFGGYGFFEIKLNTNEFLIKENKFSHGGQIVTYEINESLFSLENFNEKPEHEKFEFLLSTLEKGINVANEEISIDYDLLTNAISASRKNGPKLNMLLKISKSHKSRQLKVLINRELSLTTESVSFQIVNKRGDVLKVDQIVNDTNIYELSENYCKSKWEGNKLNLINKAGSKTFTIDVTEYLN